MTEALLSPIFSVKPKHSKNPLRVLKYANGDYPNAKKHFERLISLPLYLTMKDEQVQYVIDAVKDIVEKYHK
jgi:dTDP-4-amino-4,6-dideoxygalactose transaminase